MVVDGISVEYTRSDGSIGAGLVRVLDVDDPDNNDWVAVNQYTVVEGRNTRRPDVLILDIGMPVRNRTEAAKHYSVRFSHSKDYLATQNNDAEIRIEAAATGADGYLLKATQEVNS